MDSRRSLRKAAKHFSEAGSGEEAASSLSPYLSSTDEYETLPPSHMGSTFALQCCKKRERLAKIYLAAYLLREDCRSGISILCHE